MELRRHAEAFAKAARHAGMQERLLKRHATPARWSVCYSGTPRQDHGRLLGHKIVEIVEI